MSVFAQIESQLQACTTEQEGTLTQNRGGMSLLPFGPNGVGFEERRIDWQRDGINLAIIIQPDFLETGVDTEKWNFSAVAWQGSGHYKRTTDQDFITSMPFQSIETQIASLLTEACIYLNNIQTGNLQPMPYMREKEG